MRKVILKDGTILNHCTDATTVDRVVVGGSTFVEAGAEIDKVNAENAKIIRVYDEDDQLISSGGDLILLPEIEASRNDQGVTMAFSVRRKTEMEIIHDEIKELQDTIIGE